MIKRKKRRGLALLHDLSIASVRTLSVSFFAFSPFIETAARSLLKLRDALAADGARPPHVLAVICGMTRAAYRRPDGVFVLPITALRN